MYSLYSTEHYLMDDPNKIYQQAGAELGQAQFQLYVRWANCFHLDCLPCTKRQYNIGHLNLLILDTRIQSHLSLEFSHIRH